MLVKELTDPLEHATKAACPLLSFATFNGTRKAANVAQVYGIEGDYDGGAVSITQASDTLSAMGVEAFLYTTPSHTEDAPRWRVLAPLSAPVEASQRRELVAALNWALGGILAAESFDMGRIYFYGRVQGVPYETRHAQGEPIDTLMFLLDTTYPDAAPEPVAPTTDAPAPPPSGRTLDELREIMGRMPDEVLSEYRPWLDVGMAIHYEFGGGPDALDIWDEFSRGTPDAPNPKYKGFQDLQDKWNSFNRDAGPVCTWTTLERYAGGVALISEFDDVTPCDSERAQQVEQARTDLEAKRREHQRRENEKIGEGDFKLPRAELITLEAALSRFVFLSDGSRVADVFSPHFDLKLSDWKATYAASKHTIPQPDKQLANGTTRKVPDKEVPVTTLWYESQLRKTVTTRTFKADGGLILRDPDGRLALNAWRPFDRTVQVDDLQATGLDVFLEHVGFLFGEDAPRFLDWLAHIEQCPGELPHTAWLHIAKHFGMGRNWLASVLTRVWAGSVAANLDLVGMLRSGFNDRLSRKVLAVVDEIREGGRDSQWEHSEKLKSTITEETRRINPKYGHTSLEFNACRWLLFSNHLSAIPLENGDRRIEVVSTEAAPKSPEYYARLYKLLESPQFVAAVAAFLSKRDLSGFNPGAHAVNTAAKQSATQASQTPMAEACQLLVQHWPSDFITAAHLLEVLSAGDQMRGSITAAHRRTLEQCGVHPWGKPVKVEGKATRVSVVRNHAHWNTHGTPGAIREELSKVQIDDFGESAHGYLLDLVADS